MSTLEKVKEIEKLSVDLPEVDFKRVLLFTIGSISFALGIIGIFLPVLPTTCFMILASFCFARSSERFHSFIHRQPGIGPVVREWEANGTIRRKAKVSATIGMMLMVSYPIFFLNLALWIKASILGVIAAVLVFIWNCPEKPKFS
ncbi:MAG: YbaN family protein [Bdellovibrionota bacterium]